MSYKLTVRDTAALLTTTTLWALSFPLIKLGLQHFPPIMLGSIRYFFAALPIVIVLAVHKDFLKETKKLFQEHWILILAVGIFMVSLPQFAQNIGMQYTTASLSTLIQSVGPVIVVVLAIALLKEELTSKKILGTVVALTCTFLLIFHQGLELGNLVLIGNILQLVTAISYGFTGIVGKIAVEKITPIVLVGWSMFVGSIILFPISLATESQDWIYSLNVEALWVLISLIVGPGLIATTLWYVVLKKQEVSRQILFIYLLPFFAIIFSYLLLGEMVTFVALILGILIVIGVIIAQEIDKEAKKRVFEGLAK